MRFKWTCVSPGAGGDASIISSANFFRLARLELRSLLGKKISQRSLPPLIDLWLREHLLILRSGDRHLSLI
jgi:hypothetical protein